MKWYWVLGGVAFFILAVASIWLGGLNQDEGLYLYAAKLISEGQTLYADAPCTQGPVMPTIYAALSGLWLPGGLLAARILTCCLGALSILFAVGTARLIVPAEKKNAAGLLTFLLLGCNLYHLYYLSIPKVYAVATLFVMMGVYLFTFAFQEGKEKLRPFLLAVSGLTLAYAAGTRLSLGLLLLLVGLNLLIFRRRYPWCFLWFGLGGALGLALVFAPYLWTSEVRASFWMLQSYHGAREGGGLARIVGSLSRLVRWYLPIFVLVGFGLKYFERHFARAILVGGFVGVFVCQLFAPCPYDDYQVPIMGLLAIYAATLACSIPRAPLLALGLCFACAFGSPLLEAWTTNGHDRFWTRMKTVPELSQLQRTARTIEALDPDGTDILTQDLYLAIELNRHVPKGLELGPFAMLSDAEWVALLESAPTRVAALSGYTFAIQPPSCRERPLEEQLQYWDILKKHYRLSFKEDNFGQHATPLLLLLRKEPAS